MNSNKIYGQFDGYYNDTNVIKIRIVKNNSSKKSKTKLRQLLMVAGNGKALGVLNEPMIHGLSRLVHEFKSDWT